ncbi:sigma-54-dependent Fis family transcriptional regulator [Sporosarcina sp. P33]|uniref:sigma-54-dependent Fis family transcriptional regulator n=1 Tax=Sporosarcina sp. P33 TaxID=1930764 RepID=UPI0009BD149B|nr:sigma-54-dependent Fis family transcriptional regulator [Sporosarcina sp. P33]ARD46974.1 sigma-54-dependent Fis family transcriptional regulator [Sporosarcina sp. P33]
MNQLLRKAILEPNEFNLSTKTAWKQYHEIGSLTDGSVRKEISDSWENSKSIGVNPFQTSIEEILTHHELENCLLQNEQLLSFATPRAESLLDILHESETMLSFTDFNGTILQSFGHRKTLKRAELLNIFTGGTWTEQSAGTNAVGVALKTKSPAQVLFSEHFCKKNHEWYCAAAPMIAPFTREVLGVVNIAGSNPHIHPHTLRLIISEAHNLSNTIINQVYESILHDNLSLTNSMEDSQDAVLIVDSKKNIVQRNAVANNHSYISDILHTQFLEGLDELVHYAMLSGKAVSREVIQDQRLKQLYQCSVQPVLFQNIYLGAIIFLKAGNSATHAKKQHSLTFDEKKQTDPFQKMIGSSDSFSYVQKQAKKAAAIDATIFLAGETGTGKEVFAQAIHQASNRKDKPFIAINCGAVPRNLLESELSGYEAGAFTGARAKGSPGKFEMAQGGTIFLDEIGDMPLDLQVHLLRILEEREVTRIGSSKAIPIDVRIIAATHRNLSEAVSDGHFREDLLYRLKVIQLTVPPLRDRAEDISALASHFVKELAGEFGKQLMHISPAFITCLLEYHWPGNVRELKNVIQQALFNADGNILTPSHLPPEMTRNTQLTEKEQLQEALRADNGVVAHAAKRMGISRATMYRKMKQYNVVAH